MSSLNEMEERVREALEERVEFSQRMQAILSGLVDVEQKRATILHGGVFHSFNEAESAMREELEETQEAEVEASREFIGVHSAMRLDDPVAFAKKCRELEKKALKIAEEAIQLAGTARKGARYAEDSRNLG